MADESAFELMISEREAQLMHRLQQARMDYINAGRGLQAHGVGKSIAIVWEWMRAPAVLSEQLPDTDFGELDVTL